MKGKGKIELAAKKLEKRIVGTKKSVMRKLQSSKSVQKLREKLKCMVLFVAL